MCTSIDGYRNGWRRAQAAAAGAPFFHFNLVLFFSLINLFYIYSIWSTDATDITIGCIHSSFIGMRGEATSRKKYDNYSRNNSSMYTFDDIYIFDYVSKQETSFVPRYRAWCWAMRIAGNRSGAPETEKPSRYRQMQNVVSRMRNLHCNGSINKM